MYKIQSKSTEWEIRTREVERTSYVFMGIVSTLQRYTKKEHVTETFSDRDAPGSGRPSNGGHRETQLDEKLFDMSQRWGTWGSQQRNASMLLCKVPSARQRGMRQTLKITGDGNCRNGYHKVKCQVPETEELHRRRGKRERGLEKINPAELRQDYLKPTLIWMSEN